MRKVNKTKRMQEIYDRYMNAKCSYLEECYITCSAQKQRAYNYCRNLYYKVGGEGFRIIGYNTFVFTVGFEFVDENGVVCFAYITPEKGIYFEI